MRTVEARRTMKASPERVFEVLSDHEGYTRFPGIRGSVLVRPGATDKNGTGAVRKIDVGPASFEEEIVSFTRPSSFEYKIIRSRPPIEHEQGRVTISPVDGGCEVVWTTRFAVRLPLIGGIATAIAARMMTRDFGEALRVTEELAR
jgi:uncharacterized protein YndB with AHSA1/START domain